MYLTLASNSESDSRHISNNPSEFKNTLSSEIDVSTDSYEVGIKKIIYTNNFNSIVQESLAYEYDVQVKIKTPVFEAYHRNHAVWIPELGYRDIISLKYGEYRVYKGLWVPFRNLPLPHNIRNYRVKWFLKNPKIKLITEDTPDFQSSELVLGPAIEIDHTTTMFTDTDYFEEEYIEKRIKDIKIPAGYYKSMERLFAKINLPEDVKIGVENDRVTLELTKSDTNLYLKNGLEYVLGFKERTLKGGKKHVAQYKYNLNRGLFAIFIYSNIVEYSHVGHQSVPLLDIVSIPPAVKAGDTVAIENINPVYTAIRGNNLREIEIKLCSDTGEVIPFTQGKTLITLHIRKTDETGLSFTIPPL